jgi:uncharacterized protein YegJ (DUF2314 family)
MFFTSLTLHAEVRDHNEIIKIAEVDTEMDLAMENARNTLPEFIERLNNPLQGDKDFSLKVMVEDDYGVEHFWVSDISVKEGVFEGFIANEARTVKVVTVGQKVSFNKDLVSDWSFSNNGVRKGSYTLKVLLKRMPKEQADYYKEAVGWQ